MENKRKQFVINGEEVFFDLKKIIDENKVSSAAVAYNCSTEGSVLLRYLTEMGIALKEFDFSSASYDRKDLDGLAAKTDCSGIQLIAVMGDGVLMNAVKFLRAEHGHADIPVLYCPSYVESGDEANDDILIIDDGDACIKKAEGSAAEYVFYDPEFVKTDDKHLINTHFAAGLCRAMNILWANSPDSEASAEAAAGLNTLLANATKIMRGERSCFDDAFEGAGHIGHAAMLSGLTSMDGAAIKLAAELGAETGHAMMKLAAPQAIVIEDKLYDIGHQEISDDAHAVIAEKGISSDDEERFRRLRSVSDVIAPGNINIRSLNFQLRFLERALDLHDKDLSVEESLGLPGRIGKDDFRDMPAEFTDEDLRLLFLHTCHWETMRRAIDRYELHISRGERVGRNTRQLEELIERYKEDLSDDRIILEPYFERQMIRRKMVKGLQKDVLETLLLSKDLLEKYGLRYYLSEGTLLGAVRHRGFIPWDDDVDIMMPREDYNKLIELDRKGLIPPEIHLDALENNPKHWVLGAKLQLTRESDYTQPKVTNLSEYNGPYIDVFPLDYWNSPYNKKQYKAQRKVKMCRRLLFMKTGYSRKLKWKWHRILMILAIPFIPNTAIEKYAIKNMTRFNDGNRKFMVHLCSYYRFYKEVFPSSFYGEPVYIEFEGHMFPVPKEYDYMLRTIYGSSYDTLPPARVAGLRNHPFEVASENEGSE